LSKKEIPKFNLEQRLKEENYFLKKFPVPKNGEFF